MYNNVVYKYKIRRGSHTSISIPSGPSPLGFNLDTMILYMVYTEAPCTVTTKTVAYD